MVLTWCKKNECWLEWLSNITVIMKCRKGNLSRQLFQLSETKTGVHFSLRNLQWLYCIAEEQEFFLSFRNSGWKERLISQFVLRHDNCSAISLLFRSALFFAKLRTKRGVGRNRHMGNNWVNCFICRPSCNFPKLSSKSTRCYEFGTLPVIIVQLREMTLHTRRILNKYDGTFIWV